MTDKVKYIVTSKFAHFKVGQTIEFEGEIPAAATAHVKPFVEGEDDSKDKKGQEAIEALKDVFSFVTGKSAGKTGPKKLAETIKEHLRKSSEGEKTDAE